MLTRVLLGCRLFLHKDLGLKYKTCAPFSGGVDETTFRRWVVLSKENNFLHHWVDMVSDVTWGDIKLGLSKQARLLIDLPDNTKLKEEWLAPYHKQRADNKLPMKRVLSAFTKMPTEEKRKLLNKVRPSLLIAALTALEAETMAR